MMLSIPRLHTSIRVPALLGSLAMFLLISCDSLSAQKIMLVDGQTLDAEVLFQHPNAPLLIVRSPHHRTLQSFRLDEVHAYQKDGRTVTVSARRALTSGEKQRRDRDGLWGDEAGPDRIGKYATETWDQRPALIWAKPGESGDGLSHESWLDESGKPLASDPWERKENIDKWGRQQPQTGSFDGDILLPQADAQYDVLQSGHRDNLGAFDFRHLTVEANSHYNVRYTIKGNLWVKDGALLGEGTQTGGLGSGDNNKHTFARFCNFHDIEHEPAWAYARYISHWVRVDTGDKGSLEVIGITGGPSDRISLRRGTLVISKDSALACGNRAAFFTNSDTTLILLDGARIASPSIIQGGSSGKTMGTYGIGGTILFGTPEKPLTRDLEFSACLYHKEELNLEATPSDRASGASWVFGPTSRAVIHSSDPTRARVIFAPRGPEMPLRGGPRELQNRVGNTWLAPKPGYKDHPEVPKGVIALFRGETDFNGVVFDGFYEGGIVVAPEQRAKWRNVTFGDSNLVPPASLIRSPK